MQGNNVIEKAVRLVRTHLVSRGTVTSDVADITTRVIMQSEVEGSQEIIIAVTYPVQCMFRLIVTHDSQQRTIYKMQEFDLVDLKQLMTCNTSGGHQ